MLSPTSRSTLEFVLDHLVWLLLAVVLLVFSLAIPNFAQVGIYANIVEQSTTVGVMAVGLAIVVIAGNMDLPVESVVKKLKDKAFARSVDRSYVYSGAEAVGRPLDEHVGFIIEALKPVAEEIGLQGNPPAPTSS